MGVESNHVLCIDLSRVNHGSPFNSTHHYYSSKKYKALIAIKDIMKGEEITIDYCPNIQFEEKQIGLYQKYNIFWDYSNISKETVKKIYKSIEIHKKLGEYGYRICSLCFFQKISKQMIEDSIKIGEELIKILK